MQWNLYFGMSYSANNASRTYTTGSNHVLRYALNCRIF